MWNVQCAIYTLDGSGRSYCFKGLEEAFFGNCENLSFINTLLKMEIFKSTFKFKICKPCTGELVQLDPKLCLYHTTLPTPSPQVEPIKLKNIIHPLYSAHPNEKFRLASKTPARASMIRVKHGKKVKVDKYSSTSYFSADLLCKNILDFSNSDKIHAA